MKTILIVDDEEEIRDLLKDFFNSPPGYKTIFAGDGEEATKILETEHVDLILLDIVLPRVSGTALIRLLRHEESTREIPVIFMSGQFTDQAFQQDGLQMGATDYVTKPLNLKSLLKKIRKLTGT